MPKFTLYDRGESRIIVPSTAGTDTVIAVEKLLLNSDTGGFTKTIGYGGWREDCCLSVINIYDVAGLSFDTLCQCAGVVLAAGETDVYVRLPDGQSGWFNKDAPVDNFNYQRDPPPHLFDNVAHATKVRQSPRLNGTVNPGYPDAPQSKDGGFTRSVRLLAWAAKALNHTQATGMALGALPHSHKEIEDAIADVERIYGKPEPSTDEGVRAYNWKR